MEGNPITGAATADRAEKAKGEGAKAARAVMDIQEIATTADLRGRTTPPALSGVHRPTALRAKALRSVALIKGGAKGAKGADPTPIMRPASAVPTAQADMAPTPDPSAASASADTVAGIRAGIVIGAGATADPIAAGGNPAALRKAGRGMTSAPGS